MKRQVDFKTDLDPRTKAERVEVATELDKLVVEELRGVVFIDAKSLYVKPPKHYKVFDPDKKRVTEDPRLPKGKFNTGVKLHYYAAVNALIGVVVFVWVTGTAGLRRDYRTLVSYTDACGAALACMLSKMGCCGLYMEMAFCPCVWCMQSCTTVLNTWYVCLSS
jgi:hypothetical protein